MLKRIAVLSAILIAASCTPVLANTIGPGSDCAKCFGDSYTLTYATTANPNVFDLKLVIDATGYNGGPDTNVLNDVSLKVSNVGTVALLGSPANLYGPVEVGGLNSGGCDSHGTGFICDPYNGPGQGLQVGHPGDLYEWNWAITLPHGLADLSLGQDGAEVKAVYLTQKGDDWQSAGITSESITLTEEVPLTPTPEPSSLWLLGSGLAAAAGLMRKHMASIQTHA